MNKEQKTWLFHFSEHVRLRRGALKFENYKRKKNLKLGLEKNIMPWTCSVLTSRSNLEGRLEGQDGLAEEEEHQAVVDLQDDLQGDFPGDLHQAGAVRAAQKGSLQHRKVLVVDYIFYLCSICPSSRKEE